MALWTQEDLDKLRAAVLALASGEAVQIVRYDGPPARQVTYHPANLEWMRSLLASMQADVAASSGRSSYRLIATKKGL